MIESQKLTRTQLYERVWSKAMTKVAADFGLSDNGLRRTRLPACLGPLTRRHYLIRSPGKNPTASSMLPRSFPSRSAT